MKERWEGRGKERWREERLRGREVQRRGKEERE